ncbi:MAG TPA: hypothetical protein VIX60_09590 [Candidatus Cybelea sp.]
MFTDARIAAALDTMLAGIETPPVPLAQIRQKLARTQPTPRFGSRFYAAAVGAAAAALLMFALPSVAPGFTQTIEAEIEAIVRWKPPPPPPKSVESAMRSQTGTLAAAQSRVSFKIVPPTGLPRNVVSEKIVTTPTGVYSKTTHSWSVGSPAVTFIYRRADGRTFMLLADRFDPRQGPPSKYMFEGMDRIQNGRELIVRHENFTWRNGDQSMSAVAGEGISASEIAGVRHAMGGIAVPGTWPPRDGTVEKRYRIP